MVTNYLAGHFFFSITDVVFFHFFLNRHHHTSSHINTRQHAHTVQTHHTLKHLSISSPETSPLHSKWHEACTGILRQLIVSCMMRTCPPNSVPRYMHSGPKGKAGQCVLRESPTGRVIIVIVAESVERECREREDKRGKREEKRGEEKGRRTGRKKRERESKKEEKEQERQRRRKTHPCVRSKRLRVCGQDASVCTGKTPACSTSDPPPMRSQSEEQDFDARLGSKTWEQSREASFAPTAS